MAMPVTESFTGTGALSGSWTTTMGGGVLRDTDQAKGATNNTDNHSCYTAEAPGNNQYSRSVIKVTASGGSDIGLIVRGNQTGGGCYYCALGESNIVFWEISTSGTWTTLGSDTLYSVAANDVILFGVYGTGATFALRAYDGTTEVKSYTTTNTTYTSGKAGCGAWINSTNNGQRWDDWEGGNWPGGVSLTQTLSDTITFSDTKFRTFPVFDGFIASDATALATYDSVWAVQGGYSALIYSNSVYPDSNAVNYCATYTGYSFPNDQFCQAKCITIGLNQFAGPAIRCSNLANSYYGYDGTTNSRRFSKVVAGILTALKSDGAGISDNDILYISISGSTISYKINGSADGADATDATFTSGYAGLSLRGVANSSYTKVTDLYAGEIAGGVGSSTLDTSDSNVSNWADAFIADGVGNLVLSDDGSSYWLDSFSTGEVPLTQEVSDSNVDNWLDLLSVSGVGSLLITDDSSSNWLDVIVLVGVGSLVITDDNSSSWADAFVADGVGNLVITDDNSGSWTDVVVLYSVCALSTLSDTNEANWNDVTIVSFQDYYLEVTDSNVSNWNDVITLDSACSLSTLSDDINNLSDVCSVLFVDYYLELVDTNVSNWSDTALLAFVEILLSDDASSFWLDNFYTGGEGSSDCVVSDTNESNWQDVVLFAGTGDSTLTDDNSSNWQDAIVSSSVCSLSLSDTNESSWNDAVVFSGVGSHAVVDDASSYWLDTVIVGYINYYLVLSDDYSSLWLDEFSTGGDASRILTDDGSSNWSDNVVLGYIAYYLELSDSNVDNWTELFTSSFVELTSTVSDDLNIISEELLAFSSCFLEVTDDGSSLWFDSFFSSGAGLSTLDLSDSNVANWADVLELLNNHYLEVSDAESWSDGVSFSGDGYYVLEDDWAGIWADEVITYGDCYYNIDDSFEITDYSEVVCGYWVVLTEDETIVFTEGYEQEAAEYVGIPIPFDELTDNCNYYVDVLRLIKSERLVLEDSIDPSQYLDVVSYGSFDGPDYIINLCDNFDVSSLLDMLSQDAEAFILRYFILNSLSIRQEKNLDNVGVFFERNDL